MGSYLVEARSGCGGFREMFRQRSILNARRYFHHRGHLGEIITWYSGIKDKSARKKLDSEDGFCTCL
jgi:hypothetical protein